MFRMHSSINLIYVYTHNTITAITVTDKFITHKYLTCSWEMSLSHPSHPIILPFPISNQLSVIIYLHFVDDHSTQPFMPSFIQHSYFETSVAHIAHIDIYSLWTLCRSPLTRSTTIYLSADRHLGDTKLVTIILTHTLWILSVYVGWVLQFLPPSAGPAPPQPGYAVTLPSLLVWSRKIYRRCSESVCASLQVTHHSIPSKQGMNGSHLQVQRFWSI